MKTPTVEQLLAENADLRARLDEAEQTLDAIRSGEVDAVVVSGPKGDQIFSLVGAESIYRLIVETMKEAAFTVAFDGTILFCNAQFGQFVQRPMEQIVGRRLREFVAPDHVTSADSLLTLGRTQPVKQRLVLCNAQEQPVPVHISANALNLPDGSSICIVATDLTELENSTDLIQQLRRQQEALRDSRIAALNLMKDAVETRQQVEQANEKLRQEIIERQQAEEALRASEERFRLMVESVQDYAIFMLDPEGRVATWNTGAQRLKGYSAEEIIGQHFSCFYPPEDPDQPKRELDIAAKTGQCSKEGWRLRKDGSCFWAGVTITALREAGGALRGFAKITHDMTERRQAEEALRQSEKRYRHLFETMTEGFSLDEIICDKQGKPCDLRYLAVNPAFERQTGLKAADVVGRTVLELFPQAETEWFERYGKVALTGEPAQFEASFGPLGRWFQVSAFRTEPGRFAVVFLDITERKRMEEEAWNLADAVAREKDRLAALVNSITDEIWFADAAGEFTLVNPSGVQEFALDTAERTDVKRLAARLEVLRPDGSPRPVEEAPPLRALRGEVVRDQEEIIRTPASGALRHRQVSSSPVRDAGGNIIGSVSVVRDITERKQAETVLQTTLRRFYTVLSSMYSAVLLVTDEGQVEFANQAFCDYFGLEEAPMDLAGLGSRAMIEKIKNVYLHPEEAVVRIREILERGQPVKGEELALQDGRTCLRDFVPLNVQEKSYGRLWIHVDITERERAEEALRESQTKLRSAMASMQEAIFIADAEGRLTDFNDEFVRYHRFKNRDECSRRIEECPRYLEAFFEDGTPAPPELWAMPRALRGETGLNVQYMLRKKNTGETWWGSYNFGPIKDEDGKIVGAVVAGREITELKKAEEALRETNEDLTRFNRAAVDRELRMIELKKDINALCAQLGRPPSYRVDFENENPEGAR